MVTVNDNFFITTGTLSGGEITGGTTVKVNIGENGVEFNYDNPVVELKIHTLDPPAKGGSEEPTTMIANFLMLKKVITVNGWLSEESGTTPITKRNNLDTIMNDGGIVTVVWGTGSNEQTFDGAIIKMSIKESVGEVIEGGDVMINNTAPFKNFNVQIQILVGSELLG